MKCLICGNDRQEKRFTAMDFDRGRKPFHLLECPRCSLVATSPRPRGEELDAWYDASYYGRGESKFLPPLEWILKVLARRRARRLLKKLPHETSTPLRVLDIGCGRAVLLRAMSQLGVECHGLEREGFEFSGNSDEFTLHLGALDSMPFAPGSFHLVTIWHVLEHLDKPGESLALASSLLKPGGLLAVSVPNIDSFQARLFGRHWFHLDIPRHLWHFSPGTLSSLWQPLGLQLVSETGFAPDQNPFGFIQSALNYLLPGMPNRFYHAMQGDRRFSLPGWLVPAACLLPLAMIESLLFFSASRGATLTLLLRKPD